MSARTPDAHSGPTDRVPPFRFSAVSRVDVAETDLGAVVYYGRYVHHVDRALLAYRRHLGVPPLGPGGHLFVVRRLEVDYRASARFDDEVEAFVRVTRLGASSHEYAVRLERVGGGAPGHLADAELTIVGVGDYEAPRPTRMPSPMRDAIAAFEGL
ncbi:MAG TPA: thioesterase family protein [Miltoncostaeaceae bacterium]|nr:thioesterase family protein [Miltoncostaeaceae bacterium]